MNPVKPSSQPSALGLTLSVMLAVVVLADPTGVMPVLPGSSPTASARQADSRDSFAAQLVQQLHRWQGGQVAIVSPSGQSVAVLTQAPIRLVAAGTDPRLSDSPLQVHLLNLPPPCA